MDLPEFLERHGLEDTGTSGGALDIAVMHHHQYSVGGHSEIRLEARDTLFDDELEAPEAIFGEEVNRSPVCQNTRDFVFHGKRVISRPGGGDSSARRAGEWRRG